MGNFMKFKGQQIHYTDAGKGKAVVLLHGFTESLRIWDHFAGVLSKDYRVIRVDLPGHGSTPVMAEIHSMSLMAEVVKSVLDGLHIDRCIMAGHSMGGYVTLEFASRFPDMLSGFCLFHSHAAADTGEAARNRERTVEIVKRNRKSFIMQFIPDLFAKTNVEKYLDAIEALQLQALETPDGGIVAALRGMKERHSHLQTLIDSKVPVLFIAGKQDSRIPVQTVMAQAILPEHAEVLILGGVGHMGFIEARDETLEMLKGFIQRSVRRLP